MTDDKRTALERAKARLQASVMDALDAAAYSEPGPWTNNALVTSMVLRLDDLIEAARAEGESKAKAEAANEHPTCATCGYYDQSSGMGTKWCERHLRYLPFAGTTTLPELLGCKEHTPRAEEGEG